MNVIKLFTILTIISFLSCESMEDTYSDYKSNGKKRYLGRVENVEISAGWRRFVLNWENSVDATVKSIKIVWEAEGIKDSVVLDRNTTTYETEPIFENKSYTFNIYGIDDRGNKSIEVSAYGTPYTPEHSAVQSFGKIEKKYFFVNDKLLILLPENNGATLDSKIIYYNNGEEEKVVRSVVAGDYVAGYILLENIDTEKNVSVERSGEIDGCLDIVELPVYNMDKNIINLNSDFNRELKVRYNKETIENSFVENLETLHLDYDLNSMEDILYFTNLKKLVLGSNRYMDVDFLNDCPSKTRSKVTDIMLLQMAIDLRGLEVEVYNNQYDIASSINVQDMGNPVLPEISPLDVSGWSISCSTYKEGDNSHPEYILDNDVETVWKPAQAVSETRKHVFVIDMKEVKEIKGFLVRQPKSEDASFFNEKIQVEISDDNNEYKPATIQVYREIGLGRGETTLVPLEKIKSARYVRLTLKDKVGYNRFTYLSDFVIY